MGLNIKKLTLFISAFAIFANVFCADDISAIARKNNDFALKSYKALSAEIEGKNFVYSPLMLTHINAALYASAEGASSDEIQKLTKFSENKEEHAKDFQAFEAHLRKTVFDSNLGVFCQNILWVDDEVDVEPAFRGQLKSSFNLPCVVVDFSKPSAAAKHIAATVNKASKIPLKRVIDEAQISKNATFLAHSLASFDLAWSYPFGKNKIEEGEFFVKEGAKPITIEMMHSYSKDFNFLETGTFKAYKLPYKGEKISMLLILPNEDSSVRAVLSDLKVSNITQMMAILRDPKGQTSAVTMPRIKIDTPPQSFVNAYKKMGVKGLFEGTADLASLGSNAKGKPLQNIVSKVSFVAEEKATKAPDVKTRIGMFGLPMRNGIFNRPFCFFVMDDATNAIFLIGQVYEPSK